MAKKAKTKKTVKRKTTVAVKKTAKKKSPYIKTLSEKDVNKYFFAYDGDSPIIGQITMFEPETEDEGINCEFRFEFFEDFDGEGCTPTYNYGYSINELTKFKFVTKEQAIALTKSLPPQSFNNYSLSKNGKKLSFGCGAIEVTEAQLNDFTTFLGLMKKLQAKGEVSLIDDIVNEAYDGSISRMISEMSIEEVQNLKKWFN